MDILNISESQDLTAVYSVSEFISHINSILQPLHVTVQGEITSVTDRNSVIYFTIADKNEKAVLNCLIWGNKLKSLGISLKEGMEIKIIGSPDIFKPLGKFTFKADYITPVGDGALRQAFEKLKLQLQQQGYFDPNHKRPIPEYVQSIGLITSESGEAINDFLTHYGNHGTSIKLYNVKVEGIQSVDSITRAIRWFNEHTRDVEVLVLTRGGGSLESLQGYNSTEIAKAIYSSRIPVISAIGHENDIAIADLVADHRASTPTDAGKFLSFHWNNALDTITDIEKNIMTLFRLSCEKTLHDLIYIEKSLDTNFKKAIELCHHRITAIDHSLLGCFHQILRHFQTVTNEFQYDFHRYETQFAQYINQIRQLELTLRTSSLQWFKSVYKLIDHHDKLLFLSDPQLKLKQGYSMVFNKDGKILKSSEVIAIDDEVSIQLHTGRLLANIKEKL